MNIIQSLGFAALLIGGLTVHAQAAPTNTERADVTIRNFLDREIETANAKNNAGMPWRFELTVGQIDSRLQLAPCLRVEPQLPANTRLWGRVNVMLRCVEGANWHVSLPVTVRVFGQALVAARALAANETIRATDVEMHDVELSRDAGSPLTTHNLLDQKILSRSVAPGTILRQEWLRPQPVMSAGDMVKVVASGNGFSVTSEGQALNQASDGQTVRIKTESGRIISGTARSGRIAEIRL